MAAHRPIAHRAFTVLLTFLLVGSVVAPAIASSPAAAQSSDGDLVSCSNPTIFVLSSACAHPDWSVDTSESVRSQQIDMWVQGTSNYESWQSFSTVHDNYLNDTSTIASLEAKHAVAQAWENGTTATNADIEAREAIEDYYADRQRNLMAEFSKQNGELAYIGNVTKNNPDISYGWVYQPKSGIKSYNDANNYLDWVRPTGKTENVTVTLTNGETMNVTHAEVEAKAVVSASDESKFIPLAFDEYEDGQYNTSTYSEGAHYGIPGQFRVQNVQKSDGSADPNYPDSMVLDYRQIEDRFDEIESQKQTVMSNYPDGFAADIYDKLESNETTVEDLYGAEGMARYLSGDSEGNVTQQRFQMATMSMLEMSRPALNHSMKIEYNASTGVTHEIVNGTPVRNYSALETGTAEGLLFSSDQPDGGFAVNETYNISNLSGTQSISTTDGETISLYKGEFTITEAYDDSGNAVENVSWQTPQYGTYNATDFIQALEQAAADKQAINDDGDSGGGGGVSIGDLFGGNPAIGMVVVGLVVVLFIGGKLSN